MVQRPLAFKPGERSLHGLTLGSKGLVPWEASLIPFLGQQLPAIDWNVSHGISVVLAPYQMEHCSRRVAFVCHQKTWVKTGGLASSLSQHIRCSFGVVNVASAHVRTYGKLGFAVDEQMQLPAVGVKYATSLIVSCADAFSRASR